MNNDAFEQWYKTTKNFATPYSGFSKALTDIYQHSMQQNLELISENLDRVSNQMKQLSQIKKPEDLFEIQKKYLNENAAATIDNIQKILQTTTENIEKLTGLYGECQAQASSAKHMKENIK